jgi:hypothetical protein
MCHMCPHRAKANKYTKEIHVYRMPARDVPQPMPIILRIAVLAYGMYESVYHLQDISMIKRDCKLNLRVGEILDNDEDYIYWSESKWGTDTDTYLCREAIKPAVSCKYTR